MWKSIFEFDGELNMDKLNEAIQQETCNDEPWFMDQESFDRAVRDGFVTFKAGKTIVCADEA